MVLFVREQKINLQGSGKMKVSFECYKCKVSLIENPKSVSKVSVVINGQSIDLQYYECPVCGSINCVQADNEKSKELLDKYLGLAKVQINANRQGRRGKQSGRAKKNQIHLRKVRNELQEELRKSGIHLVDYRISEE